MNSLYYLQTLKYLKRISKLFSFLLILIFGLSSCKKITDVPPPTTFATEAAVYSTNATAAAALTGIYTRLSSGGSLASGIGSISYLSGLSSDEFTLWSGSSDIRSLSYFRNSLYATAIGAPGSEYWNALYGYIYACNLALEGLNASNAVSISQPVKNQLIGESKFMRAFFYFYLVNIYGDVPLVLTSDYVLNAKLFRSAKSQVYQQIVDDLKDAQQLLSSNYLNGTVLSTTSERVRPTKWAASALLARTYLYMGDYIHAEEQANIVISNNLYSLSQLNNVFLKNSNEAIWQLQPVNVSFNTDDAKLFIIPSSGPSASTPVYLSNSLLNSFEPGDQRRYNRNWVDSVKVGTAPSPIVTYYFPYKYKINLANTNISSATGTSNITEYNMVLRLAEQYLIRAEARAKIGTDLTGAASDLNAIRTRAGLANTTASTQSALLTAILHERQVEFFSEWGSRWLDLKRTSAVDAIMGTGGACSTKGGIWSSNWAFYPIPLLDLNANINLVQNPGY